jgi:hypothetical protein
MIENLNDLKKLLQLCRKSGVTSIELGTVKIVLGDAPAENKGSQTVEDEQDLTNPYSNFPDGILTQEQLMFYSSGGDPSEDPALAAQ